MTGNNPLNNPAPKYIEGNGVCGRLMENYQPRMKASYILDLLCALPFYYAIDTIIVFLTAAYAIQCEQFTDILLYFSASFYCISSLKLSGSFFRCVFLLYCKNVK